MQITAHGLTPSYKHSSRATHASFKSTSVSNGNRKGPHRPPPSSSVSRWRLLGRCSWFETPVPRQMSCDIPGFSCVFLSPCLFPPSVTFSRMISYLPRSALPAAVLYSITVFAPHGLIVTTASSALHSCPVSLGHQVEDSLLPSSPYPRTHTHAHV